MKQTGMFWHVHHDVIVEYCHSYDERKNFILRSKPKSEQELRLKLFKPLKGKLPDRLTKACAELDKAQAECEKAWAEYYKALAEYDKALAERDKAKAERDKARAERDKARADCLPEIEILHKKECPNCPWDGRTIFG